MAGHCDQYRTDSPNRSAAPGTESHRTSKLENVDCIGTLHGVLGLVVRLRYFTGCWDGLLRGYLEIVALCPSLATQNTPCCVVAHARGASTAKVNRTHLLADCR